MSVANITVNNPIPILNTLINIPLCLESFCRQIKDLG